MPKPQLSDFKRLLAKMTEEEVRAQLLELFNKLEQLQVFKQSKDKSNFLKLKKHLKKTSLRKYTYLKHHETLHILNIFGGYLPTNSDERSDNQRNAVC